jgi:hypothetical protein
MNPNTVRASTSELAELRRVSTEHLAKAASLHIVTVTRLVSGLTVQRATLAVALSTARRLIEEQAV